MALRKYAAAGGVVIDGDTMLLLDRPSRAEVRLPKGHIEPGEASHETALREVIEETGLADLEIVTDLGNQTVEFDHKGDHYRRTEHYYLMRKLSDNCTPRSAKDAADFQPMWAPVQLATEMLTFPAERQVAERAIAAYRTMRESASYGSDR